MNKYQITVNLSESDGQIIFDKNNDCIITYDGYNYLNNIVGASLFMPDKIFINGEEKENPYIITDEYGGVVEVVTNAIAFCNVPTTITASATVRYNVEVAFTNSLVELVSSSSKAGQIIKTSLAKEDDNTIVRPINKDLSVVANLTYPGVIGAIEDYSNFKSLGERRAVSLAQRNALKKLPQFAVVLTVSGAEGFRIAKTNLTLYGEEQSQSIIECLNKAKQINGFIATQKLNSVNGDEILDTNTMTHIEIDREIVNESINSKPTTKTELKNNPELSKVQDKDVSEQHTENTKKAVQNKQSNQNKKNTESTNKSKENISQNNTNAKKSVTSEDSKKIVLLREKYKTLDKEKVEFSRLLMFPEKKLNELSLNELEVLLSCSENIQM